MGQTVDAWHPLERSEVIQMFVGKSEARAPPTEERVYAMTEIWIIGEHAP